MHSEHAMSNSPGDCRPSKRMRLRLAQLPEDVTYRILRHVSVPDIRRSQWVCSVWRRAIDEHAAELWEARCQALGFLPPEGTDTVLGRSASRLRSYVADACSNAKRNGTEKDLTAKLVDLYSRHYYAWQRNICAQCKPHDLSSLNECCTAPCDFRWIELTPATDQVFDGLIRTGVITDDDAGDDEYFLPNFVVDDMDGFLLVDEAGLRPLEGFRPNDVYFGGAERKDIFLRRESLIHFVENYLELDAASVLDAEYPYVR